MSKEIIIIRIIQAYWMPPNIHFIEPKMQNLIKSQISDNFHKEVFNAINKIRNKHKQ